MAARGGGGQRGSALRLQEYEPQARGESGQRAHAAVSVSTSTRRWGPSRLQSAQFLNSLNKLFKVLASVFIFYSIQTSTITGVFYSIQVQKRHYSDSLFRIIHIQDPPCDDRRSDLGNRRGRATCRLQHRLQLFSQRQRASCQSRHASS